MGRREWVDGVGCIWMTPSKLGKRSQLGCSRSAFILDSLGLVFIGIKITLVDRIFTCIQTLSVPQGKQGWVDVLV